VRDRIEFDDQTQSGRSEFRQRALLEIGLWMYAVLSALIVARIVILAFNVQGNVWVVQFIESITDIFVRPLQSLPGSSKTIVGNLTLTDVTLLTFIVVVPLFLMAIGKSRRHRSSL